MSTAPLPGGLDVAGVVDPGLGLAACQHTGLLRFMPEPRHLGRLPLVWQKQPIFFITACVARRRPILATASVHDILLEEWTGVRDRHSWLVGRYVVMPDHVHFFITPVPGQDIPMQQAIGKWKEWTAKRLIKLTGEYAPLWQPAFFDHLLRSEESLEQKWAYVRDNPVRAGLVERSEDWPYAGSVDFA